MGRQTEQSAEPDQTEVVLVEREPELVACDECMFQHVADSMSEFFCLVKAPTVQRLDGAAPWPRIPRDGLPKFKGCGEGRRKKEAA